MRDTGRVLLAHADGFNWDEALMVLAPIAIIAAVLLYVNGKLQRGLGDQLLDDESTGTGDGSDVSVADAATTDPSSPA